MPASIHLLLIHGADIVKNLSIPLGALSEEAQESKNKDFKRRSVLEHEREERAIKRKM